MSISRPSRAKVVRFADTDLSSQFVTARPTDISGWSGRIAERSRDQITSVYEVYQNPQEEPGKQRG
jgi:hypothetical protein